MITSTNLNALRNLEHFQVMSNVLSYLKEENLEELKLSAFAASRRATSCSIMSSYEVPNISSVD